MHGSRILFHRHTPWQSAIRCSTNILATMFQAAGSRVAYMQGIVHGGNVLLRRGQWQSWQSGPRVEDGALVFTPFALVPYSKVWPLSTRVAAYESFRSCVPSIRSILDKRGFGVPDIVWTANPGSGVLKDLFPESRLVFQVVDYYPAFAGAEIHEIERNDYRRADHVFVIGEALRQHVLDRGVDASKVTVLGQGVFRERFSRTDARPVEFASLEGPIALWIGVLAKGDPELFEAAAEAMAERGGSLALIGPAAPWADALAERLDNVLLLGPRTPEEASPYLTHADLGLMLYDRGRSNVYIGQNPLKLYEYAAAGLAILSTPHDEYRYIDAPAAIVTTPRDVHRAVADLMSELPRNRERSLAFVEGRDWRDVYARAQNALEPLLTGSVAGDTRHARSLS